MKDGIKLTLIVLAGTAALLALALGLIYSCIVIQEALKWI